MKKNPSSLSPTAYRPFNKCLPAIFKEKFIVHKGIAGFMEVPFEIF